MSTFKSGTYGELLKWEKEQAEEKMKAEALKPKPPTHGEIRRLRGISTTYVK